MFVAANNGAGMNNGMPDTCLTPQPPPVVSAPLPYPNIANNAMAVNFSVTVKVSNLNALNLQSRIPMTNGMEAGVMHWTILGEATYTKGSAVVTCNGAPMVAQLLSMGTGNKCNCPMTTHTVPSVSTVMLAM